MRLHRIGQRRSRSERPRGVRLHLKTSCEDSKGVLQSDVWGRGQVIDSKVRPRRRPLEVLVPEMNSELPRPIDDKRKRQLHPLTCGLDRGGTSLDAETLWQVVL